jgi:CelD/BcsL family acetyltransferase involved in cellulose biosynthesis
MRLGCWLPPALKNGTNLGKRSEKGSMNLIWINPEDDPRWRQLLDRSRCDVFHSPPWIRALRTTYGFDIQALVALDAAGQPVAGVPVARICDNRGARLISLPFSDFCDPLLTAESAWADLADELLKQGLPLRFRLLRNHEPAGDPRFEVTGEARWHGLPLDVEGGLDTLWQQFRGGARTGIRHAEAHGVRIKVAKDEADLRAFHQLHVGVRKRKYRLLAQPFSFFQALWSEFGALDQCLLLLAYHGDTLLAGTFYLAWNDTLYYKFNASSGQHSDLRPNELLTWHGMQQAARRDLRYFDFGLSDADQEGLLRYKRKFSPREERILFVRSRLASAPPPDAFSQVLGQLTHLFTEPDVPDSVTAEAGDLLYRFFV